MLRTRVSVARRACFSDLRMDLSGRFRTLWVLIAVTRMKAVSATPAANSAPISDTHDPALKINDDSVASFQANQPSLGA